MRNYYNNFLVNLGYCQHLDCFYNHSFLPFFTQNFFQFPSINFLNSHNDIDDSNNNTNTGGTNEFISFYLQSLVTRVERHNSKGPMLLIPCWTPPTHTHTVHLVLKISNNLCRAKPRLICFDQIRKTQPRASTVKPQLAVFTKSSNSQDHLFKVRFQPPTQFTPTTVQASFPVWGFIMTDDDCHILPGQA